MPASKTSFSLPLPLPLPMKGNSKDKPNSKHHQHPQQLHLHTQQLTFPKSLISPPLLLAALLTLSPLTNPPVSLGELTVTDSQRGATLFHQACIGCHVGGGNIIQPGATLFSKDLDRNGIETEEDLYKITYYGKARMPGFGEKCTPRGQCTFGPRLQDEDIRLLAQFVKLQADQGWPNVESYGD